MSFQTKKLCGLIVMSKYSSLRKISRTPVKCDQCPVRKRALFQALSDDYIRDAQDKRTTQYDLDNKSHLYEEGAHSKTAYTLFSGWLLLYRAHSDGSRQGLKIALPGDFVGYSPIGSSIPRNHSAIALTDAILCGFTQLDLHEMVIEHPDLAMQIMNFQSYDMANCQNHMLSIGKKSAEQSISCLFLELFERLHNRGFVDDKTNTMPFYLTQEIMADMTGITPVHVNRIINKMKKDKLIACLPKKLTLLNTQKLMEIGEFSGLPPRL